MVQYTARLSPADQIAPVSHTTVTLCIKNDNPRKAIELLADGYRRMCRQLPYLAGSITRGNQRGFTVLRWSDDDTITLQEKQAQGLPSYAELEARKMPLHELDHDFRHSDIITREYVEQPGDVWPAMLISYTLLDGGLVIGWSLHHHLVGGPAHAVLIHRLAVFTSGVLDNMDAELDGHSPLRRFQQVTQALGIETTETSAEAPISDAPKPAIPAAPRAAASKGKEVDLKIQIFTLRVSALEQLRERLREALRDDLEGRRPPMAGVIACAVWCMVAQVRERRRTTSQVAGKEPSSTLLMPVPANSIFDQGDVVQSKNFIGNLLSAGAASEKVAALAAEGEDGALRGLPADFADIVKRLTLSLVMSMDTSFISGKLEQIMMLPDVRILSSGSTMSANDLLVTSWGNMSFTGTFGPDIGPPEYVRPATEPVSARKTSRAFYQYAVILPKQKHGGEETIELFTCLERGDMAAFEQHPLLVRLQREASRL